MHGRKILHASCPKSIPRSIIECPNCRGQILNYNHVHINRCGYRHWFGQYWTQWNPWRWLTGGGKTELTETLLSACWPGLALTRSDCVLNIVQSWCINRARVIYVGAKFNTYHSVNDTKQTLTVIDYYGNEFEPGASRCDVRSNASYVICDRCHVETLLITHTQSIDLWIRKNQVAKISYWWGFSAIIIILWCYCTQMTVCTYKCIYVDNGIMSMSLVLRLLKHKKKISQIFVWHFICKTHDKTKIRNYINWNKA